MVEEVMISSAEAAGVTILEAIEATYDDKGKYSSRKTNKNRRIKCR